MSSLFVGPRDAASRCRVLAFPYAGGGSAAFAELRARLPDAELLAAQLPGREQRLDEPPLTAAAQVLRRCLAEPALFTGKPYALLGHSMGGRLAFHCAAQLIAAGLPAPRLLVVSAATPPGMPAMPAARRTRPAYTLPDADLIRQMAAYGGMPPALDPRLHALVLPKLRADLRLLDDCGQLPAEPLDLPMLLLGGRYDKAVPVAALSGWENYTRQTCQTRIFPGGHFYLFEDAAADAAAVINEALAAVLDADAAGPSYKRGSCARPSC
ncbi:alpha/beta fold hydrolase [Rugamonas sp. FT82W]|uniref:Alpha/beta fold hydrolase n=1 Tax=Duganella vulcania TaxID=2692166 RepID=A0A845G652_9BURK|nr:alpha/beta fold hydrolase [Duganella vulcania]MYM89341.1 alpha/beta fold hydrolase [Duganella vulcania]